MKNIHNAVHDCLVDLDFQDHCDAYVDEIRENFYRVTFQERRNRNNKIVIEVEYHHRRITTAELIEDIGWYDWVELNVIERDGLSRLTAEFIWENLAIQIDPDYFDWDGEEDDDESDAETISSEPLEPLPSPVEWA